MLRGKHEWKDRSFRGRPNAPVQRHILQLVLQHKHVDVVVDELHLNLIQHLR